MEIIEIIEIKKILKERKITYAQLSDMSGVPIQTIQKVFSGNTKHPRIDTLNAIKKALNIQEPFNNIPPEVTQLFYAISQLTDKECEEVSKFIDFVVSKREK